MACKWKFFGWLDKRMGDIGHLFLGIAGLVALYQTSDVLNKILHIEQISGSLQKSIENIEQILKNMNQQKIENKTEDVTHQSTLQSSPDQRVAIFQKHIPSSTNNEILKQGDVYLPKEKYDQALRLFKENDVSSQKSFLLKNLEVWTGSKK